ncbi:LrgB family protein [Glaciecola sp. MH2013]|uniref:LrgB family protein n=1 Tax=Glaciecola sp. MH2013 TaxID=2785524 RepID=UPI00189F1219|nr:LrgB family protein [Glaciecola sp. MH2013]MBF7074842.1 LrgB family protein [Glaciecola sp. MH2013]
MGAEDSLFHVAKLFQPLWSISLTYLISSVLVTFGIYLVARKLYLLSHQHSLLHPLVTATVCIGLVLHVLDLGVEEYKQSISLLDLLLGPATVALAVPLYHQLSTLRQLGFKALLPIVIGGTLAPILAWCSVYILDANTSLQMTILVKSITTPLAIGTAELIGGLPELSAVIVILTGIVGATFAPWLILLTKADSQYAQGLALGSVAHVVGTTKALSISETCGAFATLGLCINGVLTAFILPLLFS